MQVVQLSRTGSPLGDGGGGLGFGLLESSLGTRPEDALGRRAGDAERDASQLADVLRVVQEGQAAQLQRAAPLPAVADELDEDDGPEDDDGAGSYTSSIQDFAPSSMMSFGHEEWWDVELAARVRGMLRFVDDRLFEGPRSEAAAEAARAELNSRPKRPVRDPHTTHMSASMHELSSWSAVFPHLRVAGTAMAPALCRDPGAVSVPSTSHGARPDSVATDAPRDIVDDARDDDLVLVGRALALGPAPKTEPVEEILAEDGDFEEIFAIDSTPCDYASPSSRALFASVAAQSLSPRAEAYRERAIKQHKTGFPPLTPSDCIRSDALWRVFKIVWGSTVLPRLDPLLEALVPHICEDPALEAANGRPEVKTGASRRSLASAQAAMGGLDSALTIRPYGTARQPARGPSGSQTTRRPQTMRMGRVSPPRTRLGALPTSQVILPSISYGPVQRYREVSHDAPLKLPPINAVPHRGRRGASQMNLPPTQEDYDAPVHGKATPLRLRPTTQPAPSQHREVGLGLFV